ncbi:hypothetical protein BC827DRAFT_504592 [Russula dissimulans]|nr:hypothetical protein BC827DRAFT_504592 [Russula dissimulans]
MVAYCATTLQGDTCTNGHCPYRHDILRCEPCGRSFPAPLLNQHQNGKRHQLQAVASDGPLLSWKTLSQTTRSPPVSPSPQPVPPLTYSSPPKWDTSVPTQTEDPLAHVTISDEYGLDFIVEGTGTAGDPSFPSTSHTLFVENINPSPGLSVLSLSLEPPSSPCFTTFLVDETTVVHPYRPRKVLVSFQPSGPGNFHATLSITFNYKAGRDDEVFVVTRELRGRAILPVPDNTKEPPNTITAEEDRMGSEGSGITVSPHSGLEFFVERSQPDELFATQTKELVITKSSVNPLVFFKAARVCSSDDAVASWFSVQLQGDSKWISTIARE